MSAMVAISIKLEFYSKVEFHKLKFQKSGTYLYIFKIVVNY